MSKSLVLPAGSLRHRIAIQSASESRDSMGGVTYSWSTDDTVWGHIRPLSGKELVEAKQIDARVTHKIIIREYSSLTPSHRFQNDSRNFNISSILNIQERDKLQVCSCIEDV